MKTRILLTATIAFLLFSTIGIILYPGGSIFVATIGHFSFSRNFFSDMGMTNGYFGIQIPLIVRTMFLLSLWSAAVGIAVFFTSQPRKNRILSSYAYLAAVAAFVLPFVPADKYLWPHRYVAFSLFALILVACWLLFVITAKGVKKVVLGIYSAILSAYVLYLIFGPDTDISVQSNIIHAVAQKIAVYGLMLVILIFCYENRDRKVRNT